ncbi:MULTISPECIES: type I restriction-modification system subunit M N-terminal domain-containing protein [unclassified Cyanobium]|uniref:type I restriction-modification system subunit M N-terminal domain-containing protein n=1 Tax=unclassified Cyanobium TaxID=2627006 RepID=UPI0020CCE39A|nr:MULTISPECIES: type I restriction-modification system subunit M N-terminal domain-containing protein [unclassified Cyanobium]
MGEVFLEAAPQGFDARQSLDRHQHLQFACGARACRAVALAESNGVSSPYCDGHWQGNCRMDQATHNRIVSFLWGIADDVLRDLFKRGKYPDVILPMAVLRRLDAVLEPTKARVLEAKTRLDAAEIKEQEAALRAAAGQAFYNVSPFVLRDLTTRGSEQKLRTDFEAYLEGFSDNVQDILENFKFRNHIPTLSRSDSLGTLISKFLDPQIDLSPAALDNHAMGTVFEELVRRFNEDNNEGNRSRGVPA